MAVFFTLAFTQIGLPLRRRIAHGEAQPRVVTSHHRPEKEPVYELFFDKTLVGRFEVYAQAMDHSLILIGALDKDGQISASANAGYNHV